MNVNTLLRSLPLPLVYSIIAQLLVSLQNLNPTSAFWQEVLVLLIFFLTYAEKYLTTLENNAPSTPTPAAPPPTPQNVGSVTTNTGAQLITYTLANDATPIIVTPNQPLGTKDTVNGVAVTVGLPTTVSFDLVNDHVPIGAIYIGRYNGNPEFELDGNTFS